MGERLRRARRRRFVGRVGELELLRFMVKAAEPPFAVLFVHGPGGIGKTALLGAFTEVAHDVGVVPVRVDARNVEPSPPRFLAELAAALGLPERRQDMTNFVLVHGGFVHGWIWDEVAKLLEKDGHRVEAVDLPSAGRDVETLGDLAADVAHVRAAVERAGRPVVLVGQSGGGVVVTELADHPAIAHAVYHAALWPQRGQSVLDVLGGEVPAFIVVRNDGTATVSEDVELVRRALFPDVDPERGVEFVRRMVPQSLASLSTPVSAPDRSHPVTYIVCTQDAVIPPSAQEVMASRADHVVRLHASHWAFLSVPEQVAAVLGSI